MRRMAWIAAFALVVAACADEETDLQAMADACGPGETDGNLNFYNWTEYIPEGSVAEDAGVDDLLAKFEEEYGVEVVYDQYDSNETMLAQVEAGGAPYDLVVPSDYMVEIMADEGLLVELNRDAIPNLTNLDPNFTNAPFDPGNTHSVPYQWGTTGIGFSYDVLDDEDGLSWGVIFDTEMRAEYDGVISMLNDERETLGAALKYLGYSVNTTSQEELDQAVALVQEAVADATIIFNSEAFNDLLVQGETVVAHGWNGDFFEAYDGASTDDYDAYEDFGFAIPDEGGVVWVDNMAIPTTAESPCTAHAFINFMLEPENGATLTNYTFYASPNRASEPFIDPEILEDEDIYPPEEYLTDGTLEFIEDLGDFTPAFAEAFVRAKG